MQPTESAAYLQAAIEIQSRNCILARTQIDAECLPMAAHNLRTAAFAAQRLAEKAIALAEWCDAQTESGRAHSTVVGRDHATT